MAGGRGKVDTAKAEMAVGTAKAGVDGAAESSGRALQTARPEHAIGGGTYSRSRESRPAEPSCRHSAH
eukprot:14886811-Alexandrium_andersonii.AAC.1